MTWTCPDVLTSEQGGAPGFHSCCGQHKQKHIILRELLPSFNEYNQWSFCAVVTFSSHTRWILGVKTSRKSVHCKVRFTRVFRPKSIQFFCLRSTYVVVCVFKFPYIEKNIHVRHRILNEHKLQLVIFGSTFKFLWRICICDLASDGRWRVFQAHGRDGVCRVSWERWTFTRPSWCEQHQPCLLKWRQIDDQIQVQICYRRRHVWTRSRHGPDW